MLQQQRQEQRRLHDDSPLESERPAIANTVVNLQATLKHERVRLLYTFERLW